MISREEYKDKLVELQAVSQRDGEAAHGDADDVLCELLAKLGYGDVVAEWQKVRRFYA